MSVLDRLIVAGLPLVPKFVVGLVASRYVAGESLEEAIATVRELEKQGSITTVDLLGEEVENREAAEGAVAKYLEALAAIREQGLPCNISVKPTQLGLLLGEEFCRDNFVRLIEKAAEFGSFVRIDMEDRTTTDATLRMYRSLLESYGHCGVVLQAYMRRTLADIDDLPRDSANVRLCKGIYIEPRKVAWKGYETVRANFLAALEKLLRREVYVGIATHDEYLLCEAVALIDRLGVETARYEFQMLLGVEDRLRRTLVEDGHRLRVYVPFGVDWYLYSVRRLRENPAIAGHVARAFFSHRSDS